MVPIGNIPLSVSGPLAGVKICYFPMYNKVLTAAANKGLQVLLFMEKCYPKDRIISFTMINYPPAGGNMIGWISPFTLTSRCRSRHD